MWRRLLDRFEVQMFRRTTIVSLHGPQYTRDLLPHLARFHDLEQLELLDTSIGDDDLWTWQQQHPQVAVSVNRSSLAR